MQDNHTWAVVLAVGEGKRLSALTEDEAGKRAGEPAFRCIGHSLRSFRRGSFPRPGGRGDQGRQAREHCSGSGVASKLSGFLLP